MSGYLKLSSPWCRQAIPDYAERRRIMADIPDGYTVVVAARADHSGYRATVVELGTSWRDNRIAWDPRRWHADPRVAIDEAIGWIVLYDTATYAGVEVPVR